MADGTIVIKSTSTSSALATSNKTTKVIVKTAVTGSFVDTIDKKLIFGLAAGALTMTRTMSADEEAVYTDQITNNVASFMLSVNAVVITTPITTANPLILASGDVVVITVVVDDSGEETELKFTSLINDDSANIKWVFEAGAGNVQTITVDIDEQGTYSKHTFVNATAATYKVNTVAVTFPFEVTEGDTLEITATITDTGSEARVITKGLQ